MEESKGNSVIWKQERERETDRKQFQRQQENWFCGIFSELL